VIVKIAKVEFLAKFGLKFGELNKDALEASQYGLQHSQGEERGT
jgi:hypothetical protein